MPLPEKIKSTVIHSVKESESPGGTLYSFAVNVELTLTQITSMTAKEFADVFVPNSTFDYITVT